MRSGKFRGMQQSPLHLGGVNKRRRRGCRLRKLGLLSWLPQKVFSYYFMGRSGSTASGVLPFPLVDLPVAAASVIPFDLVDCLRFGILQKIGKKRPPFPRTEEGPNKKLGYN